MAVTTPTPSSHEGDESPATPALSVPEKLAVRTSVATVVTLPPTPPLTVHELEGDALDDEEGEADLVLEPEPEPEEERLDEQDIVDVEVEPEEHEHDDPLQRTSPPPSSTEYGVAREFRRVQRAAPSPSAYARPRSSYYTGPPGAGTAFGTAPRGVIGVNDPREIVRIERDYGAGELVQFSLTFPLELEGRVTATQFIETINAVNEILISAHSLAWSAFDNTLAIATLWLAPFVMRSHYDKEMRRLARLVDSLNAELYNPQGLNILWPRQSAFLFLEIEYY